VSIKSGEVQDAILTIVTDRSAEIIVNDCMKYTNSDIRKGCVFQENIVNKNFYGKLFIENLCSFFCLQSNDKFRIQSLRNLFKR
jgi:hypothetical protein